MKNKIYFITLLLIGYLWGNPVSAKEETRELPSFSEISLRISAKVYLEQGKNQSVRIIADSETLEQVITEVKGRTLNIRFPNNNIFKRWDPGKIEIYISVPEIDGLSVSGSGDIISEEIETRILDLAVSGSGNIRIEQLKSERVSAAISGSGNIKIEDGGIAEDLNARISGSGNIDASGFEAKNVVTQTSGSGNCSVFSNGLIKTVISGSGNVYYSGNPAIESTVAGSGKVKER
ncbi:MAG TPA: head GIN domain-containing protein [Draconibacterium sp.]|nr:head GIN domain-containing protein [Draconibacterium sp.]